MDNRTILLVDDHATTRRVMRLALESAGFSVCEAKDGAAALALMQAQPAALVIQDLVLPDVDGFALAVQLRSLAGDVPVRLLAFSGLVSNLDAKRISSVGFDDVIAKPIEPSLLVALVQSHFASLDPKAERFGEDRRLLVADDDPIQLQLTCFHLTRLGFRVGEARDGQDALELARAARPDAIVSDVLMPRLDGFGLATALRREEELRSIPLILLTSSYLEPSDRELARRSGADEFVLRTPDLGELALALRTVMARGTSVASAAATPSEELERAHARRTVRQLERQLLHNTELMRRCSLLSAELTIVSSLSEAVLGQRDVEGALVAALSTCFDASHSSFGALYLLDRHRYLHVRSLGTTQDVDAGELANFFGHETWLRELIAAGHSLVLSATGTAGEANAHEVLTRARARRAIVVPLVHIEARLGALFMAVRDEDRGVELEQWRLFAQGIANQITQALALAHAFREREVAEREAEQQKRLAREQAGVFRALVEHAPDVIMQLDPSGRVRFVNRPLPGHSVESMRNLSWFELMGAEHEPEMRAALEAVLSAGSVRTLETSCPDPHGGVSWIESHLGPIRSGQEITGALVIQRDVSLKKQTEAQLIIADRLASLGTLAAGVAHEINNPLASVMANLDLALREAQQLGEAAPGELLEELRDARDASDRVRRIVKDLRVFARSDQDVRAPVDVARVLDSALRMAWTEIRHRARLVKEYEPVPPVEANEARLGQVFLNLIVNAAQAIDEGAVERNQILVKLARDEQGHVLVLIRDSGAGMPSSMRTRLFTPFITTKPPGLGAGLGLSICHRIVSSLGGTIAVDTELGKGTEFRISLPPASSASIDLQAGAAGAPLRHAGRRARVLVIDDEQAITQVVSRTLTPTHDVFTLDSAEEAARRIGAGERFDVILCDLMMPQMSGMDFYRVLTTAYPEQAERIIFFTGGAFTPRAKEFLERVPNHRLEKPIDSQELQALINDLVR